MTLDELEERVISLEIKMAVIKEAVENHLPSQIADLKGESRWFFGLIMAALLANLVILKYVR